MTPHINASIGDYSPIVLLPGDPNRAKTISTYLENSKLINDVRSCWGYTGYYNNKKISVQASGMGQPSLSIYVNELIKVYGVTTIIRIGTCGAFSPLINVGDLIIPMTSCSESNITTTKFYNQFSFSPCCDYDLLEKTVNSCKQKNIKYHVGSIVSIDNFYRDDKNWYKIMNENNILGVDMETHMLYYLGMKNKIKTITINMVSDNLFTGIEIDSNKRSYDIDNLMKVALNIV